MRPVGSAGDTLVSVALSILARNDELFQLKVSDAQSMADIAAEVYPDIRVREVGRAKARALNTSAVRAWEFSLPDKDRRIQTASAVELPSKEIYLNLSGFHEGGSGNAVYHIVANYAYNNGLTFIGDPCGLSDAALYRRTVNMLASALKFGTTRHLTPHERQLEGDAGRSILPRPASGRRRPQYQQVSRGLVCIPRPAGSGTGEHRQFRDTPIRGRPWKRSLVTSASWSSLPKEERERRERAATRLRERLLSIPWYRQKDQLDGNEFWARFSDSRVNT